MYTYAQEHTLFSIIKRWSKGPNAGLTPAEQDEQLLKLIGEIRLEFIAPEHLNSILDDPWLQQVVVLLKETGKSPSSK